MGSVGLLFVAFRDQLVCPEGVFADKRRSGWWTIDRKKHWSQYTPTTVVAAKPRNGLTPLTPSQAYFGVGFSRTPSSRSRKRGMNNSFVKVVSITRPSWP